MFSSNFQRLMLGAGGLLATGTSVQVVNRENGPYTLENGRRRLNLDGYELKMVQVLVRHGARTPIHTIKHVPEGGALRGQLTQCGQDQMYIKGRQLRREYVDEMGLIDAQYSPQQSLARFSHAVVYWSFNVRFELYENRRGQKFVRVSYNGKAAMQSYAIDESQFKKICDSNILEVIAKEMLEQEKDEEEDEETSERSDVPAGM
ncbi:hypothetical protein MAR_034141 [Mya arenaria]|uniref:Uncharacterized protein n=1 Tax=Mya arenaria TaxID=6604 RepID=A0ABY7GE51_MYAAR|nr:hypothetical protein MAR_034141 [Mya arenaria]